MKHYIKTMISVMLITLTSTIAKPMTLKSSELNWQSGSMIGFTLILYHKTWLWTRY